MRRYTFVSKKGNKQVITNGWKNAMLFITSLGIEWERVEQEQPIYKISFFNMLGTWNADELETKDLADRLAKTYGQENIKIVKEWVHL